MTVRLTRIYTRTGDEGTTALGDMSRVPKVDPRVGAYADCDEANAALGMAIALGNLSDEVSAVVRTVQNDLFDVGADLCTPISDDPKHPPLRVDQEQVDRLEKHCDKFNADLPKLDSFILPGGTAGGALLHNARAVARRAERSAWFAAETFDINRLALRYLNRLSDLLFILARAENPNGDIKWIPGGDRTL
ncbi:MULTISPECIES: cob(I)yrinic acid a,c-diamide adenosyltransferase [Dietzia]|uniref:cob(I)yrinic acid a,c-diamide adenosyltransferase n=1 Tax=Dietzia TaxID=37914 RepID=UPI000E824AA1|nr:cob(I)yrinic acid a,c-diamide adenosyltransferase [Dietzia cinnamea]MCT2299816.1 cob(I)yrinic acid a,c-diamide adenosyltransferase [Dietzia cinnamea]HBD21861.1 cob(I)yrinic acid a,c-diamide adenosyltransferase [Dietzia sp.]